MTASKRRWFRFSLRTLALAIVGLSVVFAYVGAYYRLSRRGVRELQDAVAGTNMFYYVPLVEIESARGIPPRHHRLAAFYAPANFVDHELFGGPVPVRAVTFDFDFVE